MVTVTDANGVSIWNGSRFKGDWLRYCVEQFYGPVPCLIGETRSCTPFDPTVPANIPPDVYCYFTITVVMTWPTKPPCGGDGCIQSMDVDWSYGTHVKLLILGTGDIEIYQAGNSGSPLSWSLVQTLAYSASSACIRIDRTSADQKVYLDVEISGTIYTYTAPNAAGTFTLATTIATGVKPLRIIGRDGRFFLYWIDGSAIKGQIRDRAGNVVFSTFTVVASGVDDQCLSGDEDSFVNADNAIERRVILDSVEGGSVVERTSDDGVTFV